VGYGAQGFFYKKYYTSKHDVEFDLFGLMSKQIKVQSANSIFIRKPFTVHGKYWESMIYFVQTHLVTTKQ